MNAKNILWNLAGALIPLLIAALVIPKLLLQIGTERFGLLALAWGLIGYAGAIDLGIGRATTQRISLLRLSKEKIQAPDIVTTSIYLTLITGAVATILTLFATWLGLYRVVPAFTVPDTEIAASLVVLALTLPIQSLSSTYRGVNEAYLNFSSINLLRIFLGVTNFAAPYLVSLFTSELHILVATLLASRSLALVCYRWFALKRVHAEAGRRAGTFSRKIANELFRFGSWLTISSLLSPMLVTADRFFVGALISASAVTLYVIPYEVTVQTLFLVGAVTSIAFPQLSSMVQKSPTDVSKLFRTWLIRVAITMLFITLILAFFMSSILRLWIGVDVQEVSVQVGQILCIGVFFNSIGAMHYSLLHAYGNSKVTALIHVVELPVFLFCLYALTVSLGVVGAAIAWSGRMVIDSLALFLATRVLLKDNHQLS